jgi:hypothetical protein
MSRYTVMTDPNDPTYDDNPPSEVGIYPTADEAILACKTVIDEFLEVYVEECTTAAELYDMYVKFGADPYIVSVDPNDEQVNFNVEKYLKEQIQILMPKSRTA